MKYIVGIESTAHTFGVGVLDMKGDILANVKDSYTTEEGGMIPVEVRAHHARVGVQVLADALKEANVKEEDVEVVAFSNAPGLAPCLLEGMAFAKGLVKRLDVPLLGVNHCVSHLVIGESIGARDPVMLYASGANTQVIAFESGKYRIFGETLDLGVGNFIDSIGRTMGLGFPAGPQIEKLASEYGRRNVVIVHGSNPSEEYAKKELPLNEKGWRVWLEKELKKMKIEVSNKLYPQDWNPDYEEWKKIFEKNKIEESSVLIGESAGGGFLIRWLGETKRKIRKLILVAPGKAGRSKKLNDFYGNELYKEIKNLVKEQVVVYTSEGDSDSHIESAEEYVKDLDGKLVRFERGYGHFSSKTLAGKELPELLEEILAKDCTDEHGQSFPELLELPYSVKGMDVSFSGMQTKIRNLLDKGVDKGEVAFAMQETVFAMLVEVAERALAHTGKKELLIGGGVGCNSRLQEMCEKMCAERGVKFFCPDRSLLTDNGAMIGYLGLKMYKKGLGIRDLDLVDISPRERTDEVICDSW